MPAKGEVGVDAIFECRQPLLLESRDLGSSERLLGEIGERVASPELQRAAEERCRSARRLVLRILDAFGVDRCMWGTDWTRAIGMLTYEQGVAPFRETTRLSASDKAALMGGTLQNVYKW